MAKMLNIIVLVLLILLITGCASYTSVDGKGRVIVHHFGYVRIIKPPSYPQDNKINVNGAKLVGFSVGNGFTVGYKNSQDIDVPIDCRVLVVVEDAAQLEHLLNETSIMKGDDLCATVSPK